MPVFYFRRGEASKALKRKYCKGEPLRSPATKRTLTVARYKTLYWELLVFEKRQPLLLSDYTAYCFDVY